MVNGKEGLRLSDALTLPIPHLVGRQNTPTLTAGGTAVTVRINVCICVFVDCPVVCFVDALVLEFTVAGIFQLVRN